MLAFDKACAAGADGIELDVRLDGDGYVVVFHDRTLDRLAGRSGEMHELSSADRGALRVGGEPVPLLADVLHTFECEIDVEIKANRPGREWDLVAATAKVIAEAGRRERIVVSSFDPVVLLQLHARLPDVALAFLFGDDQALPLRRNWIGNLIGASLAHPQHTLCTESTIRTWHRQGMPVNAWTVGDAGELQRLSALGVDGVFVNDPAWALSVLADR